MNKGMIKVSVMYPNVEGKHFNMDYYISSHLTLAKQLLGSALKGATVEKGLGSAKPGGVAPFIAIGNMYFDSIEDFEKAFNPNAGKIIEDMHNFTTIQPDIQISEVIISELY